jgi:hypothetical protein
MEKLEETKLYFGSKFIGNLSGLSGKEVLFEDRDSVHVGSFVVETADVPDATDVLTVIGINPKGKTCSYKFEKVTVTQKNELDGWTAASFMAEKFIPIAQL